MKLDALIFAAHPDDAEIGAGGTVHKLTQNGFLVGIVDCTEGEMGTRGTVEDRKSESANSGKLLGLAIRENLFLPDGKIEVNETSVHLAVEKIRKYQPSIIIAPYFNDRHPDHIAVSNIIKKAYFFSGVKNYKLSSATEIFVAFRPIKLFYYFQAYTFEPNIIIDISDSFKIKMEAIKAFTSQFYNPKSTAPETFISKPDFLEFIEARAKFFGSQIGVKYGEPFFTEEKIEFDILNFLKT